MMFDTGHPAEACKYLGRSFFQPLQPLDRTVDVALITVVAQRRCREVVRLVDDVNRVFRL